MRLFLDGRVKVASRDHLWEILESGRHNALGEYVRIGIGRGLKVDGRAGPRETPAFNASLAPPLGSAVAATVAADNGTFVLFHHDRSLTVGNDGRDIAETFNGGRESLGGGKSARGGSVIVSFIGTYRAPARECDYFVHVPEDRPRVKNRLYKDEFEILEGKIGPVE
ncbi:hypothetical protein [Rhodococcus wratislaviensis]|uniref:Uncharacterized protein n=1 Tax=Rhodococcus wratislaviensis NBRC 100605 TaxID=1219028 RepID=X0Q0G0_RHOWR|nr:hypothetical protein [Rhodococcus wratislaviensis]GAF49413.1 hypothetical protein RW1_081_00100 [Rhodococcus wratislaviensis NBRC 100605]